MKCAEKHVYFHSYFKASTLTHLYRIYNSEPTLIYYPKSAHVQLVSDFKIHTDYMHTK